MLGSPAGSGRGSSLLDAEREPWPSSKATAFARSVSRSCKSDPVYRLIDRIEYKNRVPPAYDRDRFTEYLDARRPRAYAEPKGGYVRNGLSFYFEEDIYRKPINNLHRENNSIYSSKEGYRGKVFPREWIIEHHDDYM